MNQLHDMLRSLEYGMRALSAGRTAAPEGIYSCMYDFVLDHGIEFLSAELTQEDRDLVDAAKHGLGDEYFEKKQCFFNGQVLARGNPQVAYYEGYAMKEGLGFPILHGWNVVNGKVVDLTWRDEGGRRAHGTFPAGREYLGVSVNKASILEMWLSTGSSISHLDNWEEGWPLLRRPRRSPMPELPLAYLNAQKHLPVTG